MSGWEVRLKEVYLGGVGPKVVFKMSHFLIVVDFQSVGGWAERLRCSRNFSEISNHEGRLRQSGSRSEDQLRRRNPWSSGRNSRTRSLRVYPRDGQRSSGR